MLKLINLFRNTFIFLPLIYIGFSLIGEGNNSLHLEILYGIPFILFGIYFIRDKNVSLILISSLYLIHIAYDYYNEDLTNKQLGELITEATVYLECHMTIANIKKMVAEANNKKAFYNEYK